MKSTISSVRFSQSILLIIIALAAVSLMLRFFSSPTSDPISAVVMIMDEDGIIGTGTLIDAQTVLTSKHFLITGKRYAVRFTDSSLALIASQALHPTLDLALLRLDSPHAATYPPISLKKLEVQTPVIALGAEIQDATIAERRGILLALDESVTVGSEVFTGLLVSDIAFQSGYSGGPLLNQRGEIIGVHTAYETSGESGWSTPVTREIISQMVNSKQ